MVAHSALRRVSLGALYLKKLIYITNFHELLHLESQIKIRRE